MGQASTSAKQRIHVAYMRVMRVTGKYLTLQRCLGNSVCTTDRRVKSTEEGWEKTARDEAR